MDAIPAKVDTLILGATCFGCGAAAALGTENSLVLERTTVAGRDFSLTFHPGRDWFESLLAPAAEELRRDAIARNALVGGRIQTAALSPLFADWCIRRKLNILFACDILELGSDHAVFQAVDGLHTVEFDKLVDAEPKYRNDKYLTALVSTPVGEAAPAVRTAEFELVPVLPENRAALVMKLEPETEWFEARRRLRESWLRRPDELAGLKLLLSANEFSSDEYANAFSALSAGLEVCR